MPQSEPITILLVNEHAEEIKLVTISLRGFFPEIRIEVAYSAEEADRMTQSAADFWAVALIDNSSLPDPPSAFVTGLKDRLPYASVILQTSRTDSAAALDALHMGADLLLYKHSPAFLTELLFCTKEAIDKRDAKLAAERAESRHSWLVASVRDILYELDANGRFLSVPGNLPASLGYRPEELIGRPYSTLLTEADERVARFRFNERRAGDRAVREFEVTLQAKAAEGSVPMLASVTARGLYDASRRFIGTIGLIRDLSARKKQQASEQALLKQRERAEELQAAIQQMAELSRQLGEPLSSLREESQQLADIVRESRFFDHLQALTGQAATAAELAQRLTRLARPAGTTHVINRLLDEVSTSASMGAGSSGFNLDFTATLPDYTGDLDRTARFFRQLLAYARAYLATVGRPHVLAIKTSDGGDGDSAHAPTLFPLAPSGHIHLDITETETVNPSGRILPPLADTLDVLSLYRMAAELGASLDVSAPAMGPFRMILRLPTGIAQAPPQPEIPETLPVRQTVDGPTATHPATAQDLSGIGTERRLNARIPTALPARIMRGSSIWEGTVMNLSVAGAAVRMQGNFPRVTSQEAVIWVKTAVATLELSGRVYTRTRQDAGIPGSIQGIAQLVVEFREPNQTETAILASLITAAHERSLTFTLDIRLSVEAPHKNADQVPSFDLAEHDRRETVRVSTAFPAQLETLYRQQTAARLQAQVINLSRSGACLLLREHPGALGGSVQIHFAPGPHLEFESHEPAAPDATLAARLVWAGADPMAPTRFHAPDHASGVRAGLRFEALTPYAERELNRVIRQHLRAQRSGEAFSMAAPIVSVPRECRNARGQTIAITDDHLSQLTDPNCPTVVVAPGYGQTASDYTSLAYYLAQQRFRVLRYDPTNHLGNSEGELQQTTLRSMQHDLEKVIEFMRQTWPQAPVVVIASDLAARAALKMAAHARPLDLLLLVNPTIDVASLLMAVHGHDLIADYQFGLRRGVCNLLGLNVNVDQFVGDLVAGRCGDLESTLEDLRLTRSPLCIATSPADSSALPPTDLPHAFMTALGPHTRLVNLSSPVTDRHLDIEEAPPAAFRQLLKQLSSVLSAETTSPQQQTAIQPYVARQHRIEQEYTFLRHDGSQINREALSAAHLAQLPQMGNLHEYRKLLDDLYGLMSPLEPGAVLVDAGLGQSDLTRAALVNHTYRAGHAGWSGRPSPFMVGVGRSRERLGQARHAVLVLQRELATGFVGRLSAMPPLAIGWLQGDWMSALPFKTGSVSRLVCNLSLPYVPSPLAALREWHRVLHPEGCLILTAFHADTDLSPLYRRYLRQANQDEFGAQAQPLLHYFGRLREAIRHGILHTFDEPGLAALMRQCGIGSFRILPIFDGHALVAIVGKQNSSSSLR
ncbi:MAG TPA: alpha/beta fold hydrolase [Nitrospira sp.]|nr:alpha/beta fold hydrolase [Nitrospira sp.]